MPHENTGRPSAVRPRKPIARHSPAQRREVLRQALAARAMSVSDMLELLEVSRATLFRMLGSFEVTEDVRKEDVAGVLHYRIDAPKVTLRCTLSELVALQIGCRLMEMFAGTGIKEDLDALLARAAPTLRKADVPMAKDLDRKIFAVPPPGRRRYDDRLDDVDDVITATLHQHRLKVAYASPRAGATAKTYLFDPYSILVYKFGLYIAGYSHHHKKVIMLALDHCSEIEWRRGDAFAYPEGYRPDDLVDGAFGMHRSEKGAVLVRIRFSKAVRGYVERGAWHPTQEIARTEDGGAVLSMRVRGTTEIASWALSFGANAEVLEPAPLREEVAAAVRAAAAMYGAPACAGQGAATAGEAVS